MAVAARWAAFRVHHTIDRPHMNPRTLSERLDDIAMGEIASVAVMHFLANERGQEVVAYDCVRTDDYTQPDPDWDLAFGDGVRDWHPEVSQDPRIPPEGAKTLSVKASRIPPRRSLEEAIKQFDFKIFAPPTSTAIGDDLPTHYVVQVYYDLETSSYSRDLCVSPEMVRRVDVDALVAGLRFQERYGRPYLVGFGGRDNLIAYSAGLPPERRTWMSRHQGHAKRMWVAPLRLARLPSGPPANARVPLAEPCERLPRQQRA